MPQYNLYAHDTVTKALLVHVQLIIMYASAMSIIVIASGQNDSDDSIERMQPSMLIEVILSGSSIHASSSPEMEYFERNTI